MGALDDTIVAVSTAAGRAAIAVVRLSGPRSHDIARRCLTRFPETSRVAVLSDVRDPLTGAVVDRAVVTRYDAPLSFTGEDAVEVSGHGGLLSPAAVTALLIREGARQADPGEFTRRALLNGKLDLLQAEAIASVVDARTEAARRAALHHADGGTSRQILALRDTIIELEALLAYDIDFPEEDDGPVAPERVERTLALARDQVGALLRNVRVGEVVREGAVVVLAGPPNAGKSSLFNALLGVDRAIVHETPGTTRDAIDAVIEASRWPLRLVDTAGLRESDDDVERTGVEVSRRYLAGAHVVVVCGVTQAEIQFAQRAIRTISPAPQVAVATKRDIAPGELVAGAVAVSAHRRDGLSALVDEIERVLDEQYGALEPDAPVLTRARHQAALTEAARELDAFAAAWSSREIPATVAAVPLRGAVHALEALVGVVDVEDVLSRVFSSFCVGK